MPVSRRYSSYSKILGAFSRCTECEVLRVPSIFALASNSILCMIINGVVGTVNSLILNGKCAAIISRSVYDMRFLDCMFDCI